MEGNGIKISSPEETLAAARAFAAALAETPQFKAFERTHDAWRHDTAAQQALSAYRDKVESLSVLLKLNAVEEAEQAELERLEQEYLSHPQVKAYNTAQTELTALCRQVAGEISEAVGLNYAASCGASCCG